MRRPFDTRGRILAVLFRLLFSISGDFYNLLTKYSPQDVWYVLVELKERKIIESVIISNRKSGWDVQYGLRDEFRN